jgi:16S rRNA (adenine1518-N6/adenine1519-N6)-dimethyltransferase
MTDSDTRYPPEADPPLADTICDMRYKIVANLPYSITSAFLRKFLTAENQPRSMTLLVQKEVAERICANAGKMSLLAVSVQLYGRPQIVKIVGKESFWPKPKVDSAILLIDGIHHFPFTDVSEKIFWQVIRSGFSAKRKQLHNNLKNCLHLTLAQVEQIFQQTGINQQVRAQELTLKGWLKLAKNYINILN